MRYCLPMTLAAMMAAVATPASAAQCVEMIFLDDHGAVVRLAQPVIGMMVGDNPVIVGNVPLSSSRKPGPPAVCPRELVANVQTLFDNSCTSVVRRKKAAVNGRVAIDAINTGCANMAKALQDGPPAQ